MFRLDLLLKLLENRAIHQGADFLVGLAKSQGFPYMYIWSYLFFFSIFSAPVFSSYFPLLIRPSRTVLTTSSYYSQIKYTPLFWMVPTINLTETLSFSASEFKQNEKGEVFILFWRIQIRPKDNYLVVHVLQVPKIDRVDQSDFFYFC